MRFTRSKRFEKQYRKLPIRLREKVNVRLVLFATDPFNSVLENHPLSGKYKDCRSINITGDLRAIYEEVAPDTVRLLLIGTHHELYGT